MNRFGIADEAYAAEPCKVSYSSFVGLFVRCALVREALGLPRAELFIYGDDLLYTLGIVRRKYTLLFVPKLRFVHDCAVDLKRRPVFEPLWKAYYAFRNEMAFYRELSGLYFYPVMMPLLLLSRLRTARHYADHRCFWTVVRAAASDGLRGDFSRSHQEVLRLVAGA
jgi:GT2 family glycosyltransferase